jgi:16S rRNA (guanine527-N7)-methyltransferase
MTDVPRETREKLDQLSLLIKEEGQRQNLIAASTFDSFEDRHIQDSLQLLPYLPPGVLLDIGSGAGLPGLVLACVRSDPIHLVEPRAKRATFLSNAAEELGLSNVTVWATKVERVDIAPVRAITARAVAVLTGLFEMAAHLADSDTRWVLPKGRSAASELEAARQSWHGHFELVPSRTDPDASIVLAGNIRRRCRA